MTTDRAKRYAANREPPHEGERVLFCEHADVDEDHIHLEGPFHWYYLGESEEVQRMTDGARFPVRFLAICEGCHNLGFDPRGLIAKDADWIGPPPEIARFI
jgi:hypothetical protein